MKRPYRTFYLYLILVGTLGSTPGWANAVGHCRIRILRQAQLQRDEVRLIDVAEVSTESEALQKQLEALVIAHVSDGNGASTLGSEGAAGELSIGRYEIMRALAGMKISSGRVALYGASRCRVGGSVVEAEEKSVDQKSRAKVPPTPPKRSQNTLGDYLKRWVARSTGLEESRLALEWNSSHKAFLEQAYEERRYRIKPRGTVTLGRINFSITDLRASDSSKKPTGRSESNKVYYINGNVDYLCEAVIAAQSLPAGHVIAVDDIKMDICRIKNLSNLMPGDPEAVVGKVTSRSIKAFQVIKPEMLKKLLVIHRYDVVDVISRVGTVQVSMRGRALSDGAVGDTISVAHQTGKAIICGKVVGAGLVQARLGHSQEEKKGAPSSGTASRALVSNTSPGTKQLFHLNNKPPILPMVADSKRPSRQK